MCRSQPGRLTQVAARCPLGRHRVSSRRNAGALAAAGCTSRCELNELSWRYRERESLTVRKRGVAESEWRESRKVSTSAAASTSSPTRSPTARFLLLRDFSQEFSATSSGAEAVLTARKHADFNNLRRFPAGVRASRRWVLYTAAEGATISLAGHTTPQTPPHNRKSGKLLYRLLKSADSGSLSIV